MPPARVIKFFKPFEVLTQFTDTQGRTTLKNYIPIPGIYAAGRLDYRSEGLLLLTDDGRLIRRLTDPRFEHPKTYYVQVEGQAAPEAVEQLSAQIVVPGLQTRLAGAEIIADPGLPPRPVPVRGYHPTTWLKVVLYEGKKHQVRRMTAAVGLPTLRLVRAAIGSIGLGGLQPGQWVELTEKEKGMLYDFKSFRSRD
jgi:23S rRNA pseudouridine2457 synthase